MTRSFSRGGTIAIIALLVAGAAHATAQCSPSATTDSVPVSPPLAPPVATIPAETTLYDDPSAWRAIPRCWQQYCLEANYIGGPVLAGPDPGELLATDFKATQSIFAQSVPSLPAFSDPDALVALNAWHSVSFRFKQDSGNVVYAGTAPPTVSIGVRIVSNYDISAETQYSWADDSDKIGIAVELGPQSVSQGLTQLQWHKNIDGIVTSATTWESFTVDFRPLEPCADCSIYFDVVFGGDWVSSATFAYSFADVTFARDEITLPDHPIVVDSPVVAQIRRMPLLSELDLTAPRVDCPHTWANLRAWHDSSTWGGSVPANGADVTIPDGTAVVINDCSIPDGTVFGKITVPATSSLIFDDADITLEAHDIRVEGSLWMGSDTCRLFSNIRVILHGSRNTASILESDQVSKAITVVGSTASIDMHGKQFHPTWTRLARTVSPMTSQIILQEPVNWEVGQTIVVVTTAMNDAPEVHQNEVRTIVAIEVANGRTTIDVDQPFEHGHFAGTEYAAEVALLSRRIVVQGADADSGPDDGFGGQIRVMGGAAGRFSGVLAYRMGQTNLIARYPFHYHMNGDISTTGSHVSDCSIWEAYYRCIVVHGSHRGLLARNVAYDVRGHCYYLEDGVEEENELYYNLAAHVKTIGSPAAGWGQSGEYVVQRDDLRQPADVTAGGFYISNAYNKFVGNVASGGWAGFAFVNFPRPIGPSFDGQTPAWGTAPENRPLLEFDGNMAHSSGHYWYFGSCVYVGGRLTENSEGRLEYLSGRDSRHTVDDNGDDVWMRFTNTRVHLCNTGLSHWGNNPETVRLESHDNARSATLFGKAMLVDSYVNARTANVAGHSTLIHHQGFELYDTYTNTVFDQVTFRGFNQPGDSVFHDLTHSDIYKPQQISAGKRVSYVDTNPDYIFEHNMGDSGLGDTGSARLFNLMDWDGTMTNFGSPAIAGANLPWWRANDRCVVKTAWNVVLCPWEADSTADDAARGVGSLWWNVPDLTLSDAWNTGTPNPGAQIGYMMHFGDDPANIDARLPLTEHPLYSGFTGTIGWGIVYDQGSPEVLEFTSVQAAPGQFIVLSIPYPDGTTFTVDALQRWGAPSGQVTFPIPEADSLASLLDPSEPFNDPTTFMCPNGCVGPCATGGPGPMWFFDGSHLFLRIVDLRRYTSGASLWENDFTRRGVTLPSIESSVYWNVKASCPAGTRSTTASNAFCSVAATIPAAPSVLRGVAPSASPSPTSSPPPPPPSPSSSPTSSPPPPPPSPSSSPTSSPPPPPPSPSSSPTRSPLPPPPSPSSSPTSSPPPPPPSPSSSPTSSPAPPPPAGAFTEDIIVTGVTDSFVSVPLSGALANPVPVCTVVHSVGTRIAVPRVRNVGPTSFELAVLAADTAAPGVSPKDVHCAVFNVGVYTEATHGVTMEVGIIPGVTAVAGKNDWGVYNSLSPAQSYGNPVLVGQIITTNDERFQTFWGLDCVSRSSPPSAGGICYGRQVGEDSPSDRLAEDVGYVIIESGGWTTLDGTKIGAGTSTRSVKGIKAAGESVAVPLPVDGFDLARPLTTAVSLAGINGGDGGFAVLIGSPTDPSDIRVSIAEDMLSDSEVNHTTESVCGVVVQGPAPSRRRLRGN